MISHISKSIALFFAKKNIINMDEIDSYIYGFQFILSTILNWSIILLIMLFTNSFLETVIYISSIIVLRHHTGGYHASTPLRCCVLSVSAYILVLVVAYISTPAFSSIGSIFILLISLIVIIKLAPIAHKNNPVSECDVRRHRLYSIIFSILFSCMIVVFTLVRCYNLAQILSMSILQVSISLLVEKKISEKEV